MRKKTGKGEREGEEEGEKEKRRGKERKISEKTGWYKDRERFREGNRYIKERNVIE